MRMSFKVFGKPVPKARARIVSSGGRIWSFTPAKTKKYEKEVKQSAWYAMKKDGVLISSKPFTLSVVFFGAHPRSDWDNLGKAVSDALNGMVWVDDSQVIGAYVSKVKCKKGDERTEITVVEDDYCEVYSKEA